MPRLKTETFGGGDQKWLGSTHGIANALTVSLSESVFTKATHAPNGYLPSGLPLDISDRANVTPYTGAAGELLGFLLFDQPFSAAGNMRANVAALAHGTIHAARLPIALPTPTAPAVNAGTGAFIILGGA